MTIVFAFLCLFICTVGAKAATGKKPAPKHSHRYTVASQLNRALAGTPLRGLGWTFEEQGHVFNVNPFFVAGITGTESSFGAARCGWNPFGWGSCRSVYFTSFEQAIRVVTETLRLNYMNRWNLGSVEQIGVIYCGCGAAGNARWAEHTRIFMRQLGDRSGGVVYP